MREFVMFVDQSLHEILKSHEPCVHVNIPRRWRPVNPSAWPLNASMYTRTDPWQPLPPWGDLLIVEQGHTTPNNKYTVVEAAPSGHAGQLT